MPVLTNRKYEAFARALFEGIPKDDTRTGLFYSGLQSYRRCRGSRRLSFYENVPAIANRVAELQGALAKRKEITVASLVDELYEAVEVAKLTARPVPWSPPAHSRLEWQGSLRDRIEVTNVNQFEGCGIHR